MNTETIVPFDNEGLLTLATRCGGFYECPKDTDGKRLGPLVGYAGRDSLGRQYVGEVYVNFAKVERHPKALSRVASLLLDKMLAHDNECMDMTSGFCGAPEGGKALAQALSVLTGKQYIFPEKKITALATDSSREQSELVWGRHEPRPVGGWWIVEDVCNNFSTTLKFVDLFRIYGSFPIGIICFLNRSISTVDRLSVSMDGPDMPILYAVHKPFSQYEVGHMHVERDVSIGNVVWKPKAEWGRLTEAVANARVQQ